MALGAMLGVSGAIQLCPGEGQCQQLGRGSGIQGTPFCLSPGAVEAEQWQ